MEEQVTNKLIGILIFDNQTSLVWSRWLTPHDLYDNSSSSALASCKSAVSNPSVNQP